MQWPLNRDIIYRDFESEIFTLPLHDESIPPEHYNKTSASESLIEVLSEELRRRSSTQGREIKILPPKQMLQRFLILLAHVKLVIRLKFCWTRFGKLSAYCIGQNKYQKSMLRFSPISIDLTTKFTWQMTINRKQQNLRSI